MKASEFYESFERAFRNCALPRGIKRLSGTVSKWIIPSAVGALQVKCVTNIRAAGLLPLWPGEFRWDIEWVTGKGPTRKADEVSVFQYTTLEESQSYTELQHNALRKFAQLPTPGDIHFPIEYDGPPRPNHLNWSYYVDASDAEAWGSWHGSVMTTWVARFENKPETRNDWCWRVLWPNIPRNDQKG